MISTQGHCEDGTRCSPVATPRSCLGRQPETRTNSHSNIHRIDASVIEADASRYHGLAGDEEVDWTVRDSRAVREYLAALDPEPVPGRKTPKVISPSDPGSAWTAKANKRVQFAYGLNYLIDNEHAIIIDAEATPARAYDEVAAIDTMLRRTARRLGLASGARCPRRASRNDARRPLRSRPDAAGFPMLIFVMPVGTQVAPERPEHKEVHDGIAITTQHLVRASPATQTLRDHMLKSQCRSRKFCIAEDTCSFHRLPPSQRDQSDQDTQRPLAGEAHRERIRRGFVPSVANVLGCH